MDIQNGSIVPEGQVVVVRTKDHSAFGLFNAGSTVVFLPDDHVTVVPDYSVDGQAFRFTCVNPDSSEYLVFVSNKKGIGYSTSVPGVNATTTRS